LAVWKHNRKSKNRKRGAYLSVQCDIFRPPSPNYPQALYKYLNLLIVARNLYTTVKQVTQQCGVYLQSNPKTRHKAQLGQIGKGQQWQIDFSELQEKGGL